MRVKKSYSQMLIESHVKALQDRGLLHKLRYRCPVLAFYPYVFLSWSRRNINIVSQEVYSLFGRIGVRYRGLNCVQVTRSYSETTPTQRPFWSIHNHARSACILEMASKRPWATLVDLELFLEGWDMGEKWAFQKDSSGFCIAQQVSNNPTGSCGDYTPENSN
jgi:hypothetical protein